VQVFSHTILNFLYIIPALPIAGFLVLALRGHRFSKTAVAVIGAGSIGLSALAALLIGIGFLSSPPPEHMHTQTLWTWLQFDGYTAAVSLTLDPLSLIMVLVISVVGFLIHLYSAEFMEDEEGYSRFFAYMNLFVGSMLILVLADNLLLLYLGWEGVGLCSYLLIGFWYKDPANGSAARKAFIVTRIGDTAMALGIFLLFTHFGTLNIQELMQSAAKQWPSGSNTAVLAAALLLGGALGKSAQLPLQTWLPDAMAGPTPVSALIHAATMVTAGVYLIARTHVLFELAPIVQAAVAIIGASTLLIAGCSALVQRDIKRVLAYSTISQIGYMFLALGVGAWSAAMFHFMTHAFFKALLFLGAGVVILAQHHEHDMFRMGGLRNQLPATFMTFFIGAASLSALPLVTAGFFSKDLILWSVWSSPIGNIELWAAGIIGAFITSLYSFRMLFIVFYGKQKMEVTCRPGYRMMLPLVILAVLSIIGGFIELPKTLGNMPLFSNFLQPIFGAGIETNPAAHGEGMLQIGASLVSLAGIFTATLFYLLRPGYPAAFGRTGLFALIEKYWFKGWGFDALYEILFVKPFYWITRINKNDIVDTGYTGIAYLNRALHGILSRTQTGNLRWYAMGTAAGAVVFLGIALIIR
jgi:NADH-quinone oxidoreductase subunit L